MTHKLWVIYNEFISIKSVLLSVIGITVNKFEFLLERWTVENPENIFFSQKKSNNTDVHKIRHFDCERDFYEFRNHTYNTYFESFMFYSHENVKNSVLFT